MIHDSAYQFLAVFISIFSSSTPSLCPSWISEFGNFIMRQLPSITAESMANSTRAQ